MILMVPLLTSERTYQYFPNMYIRNILFSLVLATAGLALQQGEIPSNIAVRTNSYVRLFLACSEKSNSGVLWS